MSGLNPRTVIWIGVPLGVVSGYYIWDPIARKAAARAEELHAERTRGSAQGQQQQQAMLLQESQRPQAVASMTRRGRVT